MVVPGVQGPSPVHTSVGLQVHDVVQRAGWLPQSPHEVVPVVPGTHTPSPMHAPYSHVRVELQKRSREPHIPQVTVSSAPGVGHASARHAIVSTNVQASSHVTSRVWPDGHPSEVVIIAPGAHSPSAVHAPVGSQVQLAVQRVARIPQLPHAIEPVVPAAHSPSPSHTPYAHTPPAVQKRSTLPHIPHETVSTAPGVSHVSGGGPESGGPASTGPLASTGRPASMGRPASSPGVPPSRRTTAASSSGPPSRKRELCESPHPSAINAMDESNDMLRMRGLLQVPVIARTRATIASHADPSPAVPASMYTSVVGWPRSVAICRY